MPPSISQQFIDKVKPKPYVTSRPLGSVQQPLELHSTTIPSHFLRCAKCLRHRGLQTERAALSSLQAANTACQTPDIPEAPWKLGLRSRPRIASKTPGKVALLLPHRTTPVSPTRDVTPPASEALFAEVPLDAATSTACLSVPVVTTPETAPATARTPVKPSSTDVPRDTSNATVLSDTSNTTSRPISSLAPFVRCPDVVINDPSRPIPPFRPVAHPSSPVLDYLDPEDLLRNRFKHKRSFAEYFDEDIVKEYEDKVDEAAGPYTDDLLNPGEELRRPKTKHRVRRTLPIPREFSSRRIFAGASERAKYPKYSGRTQRSTAYRVFIPPDPRYDTVKIRWLRRRKAAKEREQQARLERERLQLQSLSSTVSAIVPPINVAPDNAGSAGAGFSTRANHSTHNQPPANSKSTFGMSWWDGAKGFAGWVASSVYILAAGSQPRGMEDNAGQSRSPEQGRQSPKRQRTGDHIPGQPRWQPGPIGVDNQMTNDDRMEIDTPSPEPLQTIRRGFPTPPGSPPQILFRHSTSALGFRSSSAATTAMRAMRTSMYTPRSPTTRDRRAQGGPRNQHTSQSVPHSSSLRHPYTEVDQALPQTLPSTIDSWVGNPSVHSTPHAARQEAPNAQAHSMPGGWVKSPQPQNAQWSAYRRSATSETSASSSNLALGGPDKGSSEDELQRFEETPRSDPPASFKLRTDWFSKEADHCLPGFAHLSLKPDAKKIEQLEHEKHERERLVEEARRAAERAKWDTHLRSLGLRSPKQAMITDLDKVWNEKVNNLLVESKVTCSGPEAVTMMPRDFAKLVRAHEWLNDSAVQAALTELATAINKAAGVVLKQNTPKCAALGPFFWSNLEDSGPKNKERMLKRTWGITPQNFLDIETLLMPINSNNHWTFMLIRPKRREVSYVDSMGGVGQKRIQTALKFIEVFLGADRWNAEEWNTIRLKIPRQLNGHDCGVFVITNAMYLALGLDPMAYSESDMPLQRRRIAAALLNGGFKGEFDLMGL